ncbi:MAG: TIGR00266 family protein [Lachnospiraceae bacterium]|nr:TIGR00266 family protein [Lachnospiraceae bacterium]
MTYEIKGGAFPVVECRLTNGEQIITESGAMVWMTPNMEMSTKGGGIGKMFSKVVSGENMFQNIYTAKGNGLIAFGSSFPGKILAVEIGYGRELIVQKSAFLASETGVQLSIHFNKKAGVGFFGGEGFIMQRLSGRGIAFIEVDGSLEEYELASGEQLIVDTGNLVGIESSVSIDVQTVKGVKNMFFGGEGIFNTVLTGPGKVYLQTMPISTVANAVRPYIPTASSND